MDSNHTSAKHSWTCSVFSGNLKAPGIRENSDLSVLQCALPIVKKKAALGKLRCRRCTQAHTVMMCCALVCFSNCFCVIDHFHLWIWTLGILGLCRRSDSYSELVYLDRWRVGLQALAFNQGLQWQHVGWNQTITLYQVTCKLRAFTKSQRTQTVFTVTFPWQRVHQYGEQQ